jgi:hypothetical protein
VAIADVVEVADEGCEGEVEDYGDGDVCVYGACEGSDRA